MQTIKKTVESLHMQKVCLRQLFFVIAIGAYKEMWPYATVDV